MNKTVLLIALFVCVQLIFIFLFLHNTSNPTNSSSSQTTQLQARINQLEDELQRLKSRQGEPKKGIDTGISKEFLQYVQHPAFSLGNAQCSTLMSSLRKTQHNCTVRSLPKNMDNIHPYVKSQVEEMIFEEDLDCFYDTPYSAAVLYLGPLKKGTMKIHGEPKNRTEILVVSLKRLHKYYNSLFHYPIFVFHEDYTKEDIKYFRDQFGHPLHFVRISFDTLPPCANSPYLEAWLTNPTYIKNPKGYRQMCRFWSGIVQNAPILSTFDFYLRLDDETMMYDWIDFDFFEYMTKFNKTYLYQAVFGDELHSDKLWNTTVQWLQANNKSIPTSGQWMSAPGVAAPYNNFHTSRLDIWKSKELGDLFEYLEGDVCGFIQHAWGDANFHGVAIDSLVDQERIEKLEFVPVQHNWNFHRIRSPDPDAWAFDPDVDIQWTPPSPKPSPSPKVRKAPRKKPNPE